jgi:hypothetical protein
MAIKLGIKIKKFIDITNNITKEINRFKKGSVFIYLVEKNITHIEIKITSLEKRRPIGSKMILKLI